MRTGPRVHCLRMTSRSGLKSHESPYLPSDASPEYEEMTIPIDARALTIFFKAREIEAAKNQGRAVEHHDTKLSG